MAANAHNEFPAEDEIPRSADELKKVVSDANVGDKIPAMDRSALDTQEWRPVVLECIELLVWRLLDEHGEVLDEGPTTRGSVQSSDRTARGFVSYYLVVNVMRLIGWSPM